MNKHQKKWENLARILKTQRKASILAVLLLSVVIVVLFSLFLRTVKNRHQAATNSLGAATSQTATICAVGDIAMNDDVLAAARQPDGSYDFTSCFLQVASRLSPADLTIGNLELSFSGAPYGNPSAPDELAESLKTVGFDLLQTANSKSISGGVSGLRRTMDVLEAAGLDTLGTYASQEDFNRGSAVLKEINGIRIAFLGFTKGFDGMSIPAGSEYCADVLYTDYDTVYSEIDEDAIRTAVDNAKSLNPDVIIAMVHWGSENMLEMSDSQEDIASLMFGAGVDVILGSHSHIVGQMEYRTITRDDDSEATVFLASNLGNFLGINGNAQESAILNLTFEKNVITDETTLADVNYVPVYLTTADSTSHGQTLDIYQSMELYEAAYLDRVDDETYEKLPKAIERLKSNTNSEFDCGPNKP